MGRRATGQVLAPTGKQRSWAIRFQAYGKRRYVSLGLPEDGWNRQRAEEELSNVLADVRRGIWQPHEPDPVEAPVDAPGFLEFASHWMASREPELRPKTVKSYRWQLELHLLPYFGADRVDAITAQAVDQYKAAKLREGTLGPNQINKTLSLLAQILDAAGDYGYTDPARNPARGPRRRVRATRPERSTMEPEQLPSLLEAAGRTFRPVLAVLAGAGLRNGEACALNWQDVNLAGGTLTIRDSKTDAGVRSVDLPDALRELLIEHKQRARRAGRTDPVLVNRAGGRQTVSNVERRLKTAVRAANVRLERLGLEPISARLTPHSLRRLYSSLRFGLSDDPVYVAEQLGHTEPTFSMKVYASAVRRRKRLTGNARREFDRALEWAEIGRIEPGGPSAPDAADSAGRLDEASQSRKLRPSPDSSVG